MNKLPWGPLYRHTKAETVTDAAKVLGVTPRTVNRWMKEGVPRQSADQAAVAVGCHPMVVWPKDWENDDE